MSEHREEILDFLSTFKGWAELPKTLKEEFVNELIYNYGFDFEMFKKMNRGCKLSKVLEGSFIWRDTQKGLLFWGSACEDIKRKGL